ncbi:hypothetical protein C0Q70_12910 [Pomacea canaliculata]|uniref:G-protein coupled receptors family 1 profile domain-containing protein n=1 Tax=Pomacea canaliculata TaxID=400727 RepID=A0A2T7P2V3_POMCA|nr:hypothetical protein C0Q70_12910 [Pomacea canaliculata]
MHRSLTGFTNRTKRFFFRGHTNANSGIQATKTPVNKRKGSCQEEAATEASENFFSNENTTEVSELAYEREDVHGDEAQRAMNGNERPQNSEDCSVRCDPQTVSAFFKREDSLPGNGEDKHAVNMRADEGCSPDANVKGQLRSAKPACSAMPENSSEASSASTCENRQKDGVLSTSTNTASDNLDTAEAAMLCTHDRGQGHREEVMRSDLNPQRAKQGHQRRALLSKTTFMMFVLTVATLLCYLPYIALMIAKVEFAKVHLNSQKTSLYFIARSFPIVNSIINPFIYSFCNSKFPIPGSCLHYNHIVIRVNSNRPMVSSSECSKRLHISISYRIYQQKKRVSLAGEVKFSDVSHLPKGGKEKQTEVNSSQNVQTEEISDETFVMTSKGLNVSRNLSEHSSGFKEDADGHDAQDMGSQAETHSSRMSSDNEGESHKRVLPRSGLGAPSNPRARALFSRNTFMMLLITVSTVICCIPYFALTIAHVQYVNVHLSSWKKNINYLFRYFPMLNSVINPFIYSFCNPKFRSQARRLLTKIFTFRRPVETDRPGITGTTCGFPDMPLELKVKQIFGLVLMAYFFVGFALLTTCYLQISYRIYQQKKKVLAGEINVGVNSCGMKTFLKQGVVSSQEELQTEASQNKFISTYKSEMDTEELNNQEEHLRVVAKDLDEE